MTNLKLEKIQLLKNQNQLISKTSLFQDPFKWTHPKSVQALGHSWINIYSRSSQRWNKWTVCSREEKRTCSKNGQIACHPLSCALTLSRRSIKTTPKSTFHQKKKERKKAKVQVNQQTKAIVALTPLDHLAVNSLAHK